MQRTVRGMRLKDTACAAIQVRGVTGLLHRAGGRAVTQGADVHDVFVRGGAGHRMGAGDGRAAADRDALAYVDAFVVERRALDDPGHLDVVTVFLLNLFHQVAGARQAERPVLDDGAALRVRLTGL